MTANKNLKRLVRSRARKTGESYAAALRNFLKKPPGDPHMPTQPTTAPSTPATPLRRIEKPEYGFTLHLPADWREDPPDPFNSEWEVARFSAPGPILRNCLVFRNPQPPGATLQTIARQVEAHLTTTGFANFRHLPARFAGLPAARLDFDRPAPDGGLWSCRHHFLLAGRYRFCVSFGTRALAEDAPLLDLLASRVELTGDPPGSSVATSATTTAAAFPLPTPPRFVIDPSLRRRVTRYTQRARAVLIAAHQEAVRRRSPAVDQPHLLSGLAGVEGSMGLQILEDLGLPHATLRRAVDSLLPPIPTVQEPTSPDDPDQLISIPMTGLFQGALTLAEEASRSLGHNHVGVEHLLLGLLHQRSGPAHQLLAGHGITAEAALSALRTLVPSAKPQGSPA